jgi:PPOX class probable F420-dependent enzyme
MIDFSSEHGSRAMAHLRDETVVWLTTVSPAGAPLPMPVWFLFDGQESVLVYSMSGARVRNVQANPKVTLNFPGDGGGGDIVVLSGEATIDANVPSAELNSAYLAKYEQLIGRLGLSPAGFAERYAVPIRIGLNRLRGH